MAEKTNLGTLADEVAAGVGEACRVIDALRAENAGLKTGLATLQDGIASALGWDCKGVPFTDLIRKLRQDRDRLLEACKCGRLLSGLLVAANALHDSFPPISQALRKKHDLETAAIAEAEEKNDG